VASTSGSADVFTERSGPGGSLEPRPRDADTGRDSVETRAPRRRGWEPRFPDSERAVICLDRSPAEEPPPQSPSPPSPLLSVIQQPSRWPRSAAAVASQSSPGRRARARQPPSLLSLTLTLSLSLSLSLSLRLRFFLPDLA
jgi:hypothetical protein